MWRASWLALTIPLCWLACSEPPLAEDAGLPDRSRPDTFRYLSELPSVYLDGMIGPSTARRAPFLLDFETGPGGLTGSRDWEWGQLSSFSKGSECDDDARPPPAAHSGKAVWGTVLASCYHPLDNAKDSCKNSDSADDSVLSLDLELPAELTAPRLTYWEWPDYFLSFDWSEVRIDGQVVKQHCQGPYQAPTTWVQQTIDLAAHAGKTIRVTFHFMASSVVNLAGWYIDDLAVSGGGG